MASKKLEKGSDEWQFFQDFWKFRQKYYDPEDKDEWFNELINEATLLSKKYENTEFGEFARQLLIVHIDDVDRRCKGK